MVVSTRHLVVRINKRRAARFHDVIGFIQRLFAICPWVEVLEIPDLRHQYHECHQQQGFLRVCIAFAGHASKIDSSILLIYPI